MIVVAALVAGWAAGWLLWIALGEVFSAEIFARRNFRGAQVATATGVVAVVAVLGVEAGRVLAGRAGMGSGVLTAGRLATVLVAGGFGLLGLLDDIGGSDDRGFRGHLRVLRGGRLSTGGLKLLGGGLVSLVAASLTAPPGIDLLLLDAVVVALAANAGNLFDRAPGRTLKVGAVLFAVLVAASGAPPVLAGPAVAVGACLALLIPDLRERIMLGDAGSNVLGAAVGLGAALASDTVATIAIAAGLVVLNIASELVSFSRIIDRVAPLRFLDGLGRARSAG